MIPEERLDQDTPGIKKRKRYINKCEEAVWKRWGKDISDPFEKGTI